MTAEGVGRIGLMGQAEVEVCLVEGDSVEEEGEREDMEIGNEREVPLLKGLVVLLRI